MLNKLFDFSISSLERLLSHVRKLVRTRDYEHQPLDTWFDDRGHLLLVGQAAHAASVRFLSLAPSRHQSNLLTKFINQPAGNHPAALCVEDAFVLGRLFQRIKRRSQIKHLLSAFQELREARWEVIKPAEADKLAVVTMPPGSLRDLRDETMRKEKEVGIQDLDFEDDVDDYLRTELKEYENFGYDAVEEVDTWWVEWGVLLDRVSVDEDQTKVISENQIHVARYEDLIVCN